jgi:hypothetical protein
MKHPAQATPTLLLWLIAFADGFPWLKHR